MSGSRFQLGPGLECDLDRLVATRLLVQANSGGGKSRAVRRILEQTAGKIQQLVIDPDGEFSTLREKHDYILAAPSGGDTVASVRSAKLLAERLLELGVSAILDIFELPPKERVQFVRLFLTALVDAPKKLWHPVLVVVDEAHVFCPQKGEAESAGAVIDLASRGRKRGFCAVFATQRLSKLHKDAAAECNNKLIGRASLDLDMNRAAEELGFVTREDKQSLRLLEPGEFFAFGPAIANQVTKVRMGAVFTTHPEAGARIALAAPPPTKAVLALLPQLSDLPAEAEAREKSIEDLRRELASTRRELTLAQRGVPAAAPKEVIKTVEKRVEVLKDGQLQRAERLLESAQKVMTDLQAACKPIADAIASTREVRPISTPLTRPVTTPTPRAATTSATTDRASVRHDGSALVSGPMQKMLDELATWHAVGIDELDKGQFGYLCGYTNVRSGGFTEPLGKLVTAAFVEYPRPGFVAITRAGLELAVVRSVPQTSEELQERLLQKLTGPQAKLARQLLAIYPNAIDKHALGRATGYTNTRSGGFTEPLGQLVRLGLVNYPRAGEVAATSRFFLPGGR